MQTELTLPKWLDDYIFKDLGAKYCTSNSDMTVIDWDKDDVLNYLGTYFPRSYTESYCIFSEYFSKNATKYADKETLSLFDFGCGTGGEIIGFAMAVKENCPGVKKITGYALDGNFDALDLYRDVANYTSEKIDINIELEIAPTTIHDIYDLSDVSEIVDGPFDFIITFKAICEFVNKERFVEKNAYEHVVSSFISKLKPDGKMLLVDVTTYSNVTEEWLPKMMDKGLTSFNVKDKNPDFNQSFYVSHSRKERDRSKIAWRLITK